MDFPSYYLLIQAYPFIRVQKLKFYICFAHKNKVGYFDKISACCLACPKCPFPAEIGILRVLWSSFIISLVTGPVFVSSLKFEVKEMMHQLPPLPYDDPNGILTDFRQHILEKVSCFSD